MGDVADDGQVVGDEQVGETELPLEVLEQVDDLARTETSSAETGSSATMNVGSQGEGPGDADALALSAGEAVRETVGDVGERPQRSSRATT